MTEPTPPRPVPGPPAAPTDRPESDRPESDRAESDRPETDRPDADRGGPFAHLADRPASEHVAVFEAEHARLQRELDTIDQL